MSRWLSWLSELQPEMFCEVAPELAELRGLTHTGWATLSTARGSIVCRVLVTERMKPLTIAGRTIHQIAVPWHWGGIGRVRGDSANELFSLGGDPNVLIQDSKVATVDIRPGRRIAPETAGDTVPRDLPGAGQPSPEPAVVKE
jgi:formate dehydrogenase major subunit